jgi:prolyl-tRNA synthetase
LRKIEQIVREEQNRAGAIEMLMPTLQLADLWRESGRYDDYGKEMLRIVDRHEREMLYGPTNEEMITEIFRAIARSYKDLPKILYHIQWKFRDEIRPRFGVMRGREFLMKDAYSFDLDEAKRGKAYNKMFVAYLNTFARLGLKSVPMRADTGPIGGELSHEFIILAETGESEVFCDAALVDMGARAEVDFDGDLQPLVDQRTALYAATEEMHDAARFEAEVPQSAACPHAASKWAISSISAPSIPTPMKAWSTSRRQGYGGAYGLLWGRRLASDGRDHRSQP